MLYSLSSYCIMTIMIIVYKMVALLMAYCTCTVLFLFVFCLLYIILCVDNLFFYLGGQTVSCKASLAALRLYGCFCDFLCGVIIGE